MKMQEGENPAPVHVAIIADGNRRWARERGLAPMEGHLKAYGQVFELAEYVYGKGAQHVTFFAFSTENWKRAQEEVHFLLGLLERFLAGEFAKLHDKGFRIRFFGSREGLSAKLVKAMEEVEVRTQNNPKMSLNICFNYGGRRDLVEAMQALARDLVPADEINEAAISARLSSHGTPPVDLVIRTSGEQRLSNFLLWEAYYAELVFMDCYWPDFGPAEVDEALAEYHKRHRRIGA
jgi:undecaprenyl diphosphate synthase